MTKQAIHAARDKAQPGLATTAGNHLDGFMHNYFNTAPKREFKKLKNKLIYIILL
jgi:hypothetical protein